MYSYNPPPPYSPPPPMPPAPEYRAPRKSHNGLAIVGICLLGFFLLVGTVAALSGSGTKPQSASAAQASSTTTTTRPITTTTSERDAMLAWGQRSMSTMISLKQDLDDISTAAEDSDLVDLRNACESLGDHASQLRRELPTPDPDMTAELASAADDFESASTSCVSAARTLNTSTLRAAIAHLDSGNRHIETATALLGRYDA